MPRGGGFRGGGGGFRGGSGWSAPRAPSRYKPVTKVANTANGEDGKTQSSSATNTHNAFGWWYIMHHHRSADNWGNQNLVSTSKKVDDDASDACRSSLNAFQECMKDSNDDSNKCQLYMKLLSECRKTSASLC